MLIAAPSGARPASVSTASVASPSATAWVCIFSSGYFRAKQFWTLGLIFGAMYLAVILGVELPYLRWLQP